MTAEVVQAVGQQQAAAPASGTSGAAGGVKKEPSPKSAAGGSREGTPGAGVAVNGSTAGGEAQDGLAAGSPGEQKLSEEQLQAEEELLAKGREIGGVRALLARAYTRPAEEPARALSHHDYLLQEMHWLAVDMTQERLWKQATALAFAYQIASMRGQWGLKPPPKDQRKYHDEIAVLRAAATRDTTPGKATRAAMRAAEQGVGSAGPWLQLEPGDDPVFAEIEAFTSSIAATEKSAPGTPPLSELCASLAYCHDEEFQEFVSQRLMECDMERMLREEIAYREACNEYDAALASHFLAVQEANRRAAALEGGLITDGLGALVGDGLGLGLDDEGKKLSKANKNKRPRYLMDDVSAGLEETETKRPAPSRQYVEDTYLRKKQRRDRYRDVDTDYDVTLEGPSHGGRYTTRRTTAMAGGARGAGASRLQAEQQRKLKASQGRTDSFGAQPPGAVRSGRTTLPGMVLWAKSEDELLLAICHEFGINWTLVSEVLSLSLSMQGIYRPPHLCKQRFRQLTAQEGQEYVEDRALASLNQQMGKTQARELLVASLPVRDDVLMRLTESLVQIGAAAKQRKVMEDKRNEAVRTRRQDPHTSHLSVQANIMSQTGGQRMNPLQLMEHANQVHLNQARQQQMQMQQAAAVQMQAQQAAAGAAQPGGAPGQQQQQQQQQQQAAAAAQMAQAAHQQQQAAAQQGAAGMQQAAAGQPMGVSPGMATAQGGVMPGQPQQQMAAGGQPAGPGLPGAPPAVGQAMAGQPAGAGPGAPPKANPPQITLQQLNHILNSNKLPNGQPLSADMRKAIQDKRDAYLAQMQATLARQQQMAQLAAQQQQQAAAAAAAAAGGPTATQAALQAAQQAAAVQGVGVRPPMQVYMPPGAAGIPGMQAGAPGQPMQLPPGAVLPTVSGQVVMPPQGGLQPGMQLGSAQQQQLLAQQIAMQQQAAAAAAAQQQPG